MNGDRKIIRHIRLHYINQSQFGQLGKNNARRQAQAMLAKAEADIAQQRKKAVNEVKDELGGIAVDIASKVVEREVRPEDHAKLIDEFIDKVGDGPWQN